MIPAFLYVLGCGGLTGEPTWEQRGHWELDPPPIPDADCPAPIVAVPHARVLDLHVVVARGVAERDVHWHVAWARVWWASQGVAVKVSGWREHAGSDPVLVQGASLAEVVSPLRGVLLEPAPAGHVRLVVLPRLASEGSPAARWFDPLLGLTVSPHHQRRRRTVGDDPGGVVLSALGLPEAFTPTVWLSMEALDALPQERSRFVLAHELGHAMGLSHVTERGRLMGPGFPRCAPTLSDDERRWVQQAREE